MAFGNCSRAAPGVFIFEKSPSGNRAQRLELLYDLAYRPARAPL
jgi:hypothetical protein